ncbi:MAG: hypothetical protein ACK4PR_10675 [Gammaproteobacteria bacterium]
MKKLLVFISLSYLFYIGNAFATMTSMPAANEEAKQHFLDIIQKLPEDATPIQQCNADEMRFFLQLMINNHITNELFYPTMVKVEDDGSFVDGYGNQFLLFKGNFNNTGVQQYLLLATAMQMMSNFVVGVWQVSGASMTELDFDHNVVNGVIGHGDMSSFYLHVAKPFAYISNGKTYLRFMQTPDDIELQQTNNQLQFAVCTYMWQGQSFSLVGPSQCIGGKK